MLDPILDIWVMGIQQKIDRLGIVFKAYVDYLAERPDTYVSTVNHNVSILDEDDEANGQPSRDIINQLQGLDTQLTQLLNVLDVNELTTTLVNNTPIIDNTPINNVLDNILSTLKTILPVNQMVAIWFQTEMLTDPESIYYSPNFSPDVWLDNKINS